jgi:hypothetical protein
VQHHVDVRTVCAGSPGDIGPGRLPSWNRRTAARAARRRAGARALYLIYPKGPGHLLVVGWAPSDVEGNKVLFVFDGGQMDVADLHTVTVDERSRNSDSTWLATSRRSCNAINLWPADAATEAGLIDAPHPTVDVPFTCRGRLRIAELTSLMCPRGPPNATPARLIRWKGLP